MSQESNANSSSLDRALTLLQEVCLSPVPMKFSELVEQTGIPKATAHRAVNSLLEKGLLRFDENNQSYQPGFGLLQLAHQAWSKIDVRDMAADQIKALWKETGETIHLAVFDRGEVIYIDKMESPKSIRLFSAVGKKGPAYCTGVGKAILAFLKDDQLEDAMTLQSFQPHTATTITSAKALKNTLLEIQKTGVALDMEEHEEGIQCAAAPIFNHLNEPIAALSITVPKFRLKDDDFEHFKHLVKQAGRTISKRMGAPAI